MRCSRIAILFLLLLLASSGRASETRTEEVPPNTLSAGELAQGWILLFDGRSTFGWEPGSDANWKVSDGVISVDSGQPGLLCTTSDFGDYRFQADFRAPKTTNSGIFLRTPLKPTDPARDCYELNIAAADVSPFSTGSFVGRQKAAGSFDTADWRRFDVSAQGGHFTVRVDGEVVLDYTDPTPLARGRIGLQLNKGRVEFRNLKLLPLGLRPLLNGRDLDGWKIYPGKNSQFSVTPAGELSIKNGNGQIETEGQFQDFVLDLEAKTNGRGLNSGIFFRAIPGEFWQGYECQIHNACKNGDRMQPADCGTGGFYRRQNAREIVANDLEWFRITLVVSGAHMAAWVDGRQVSDWTDTRTANANPRQGQRLAAGTITLQGHDPTTDLLFRGIKIAELHP